jgi:hypothetical protein
MKSKGTVATRFERLRNFDQSCEEPEVLTLAEDMVWFPSLVGNMSRGIRMLMAGDPGAGESSPGLQLAPSAFAAGGTPVIVTTEQSGVVLRQKLGCIAGYFPAKVRGRTILNLPIIDDLNDLISLPSLLAKRVFRSSG